MKGEMAMQWEQLLSSGEMVDVYKNGDLAVKVFHEGSPKTVALYEALTHARIEETGLPVPKIHEVSVIDNKWTIQMDLIEGKTLADVMREHPEETERCIELLLNLQLTVHQQRVPMLRKLKDKLQMQIQGLTCIDDVRRYELLTRLDSIKKHDKLCHGNFGPDNILIDQKNKTYIVDWVAAAQGNASADAGRTYLLLSLRFPQAAERYLNLFCQKTNTSKKYVQEWLPIVAAAQLAEGRKEERELLMRWIDVVDYE